MAREQEHHSGAGGHSEYSSVVAARRAVVPYPAGGETAAQIHSVIDVVAYDSSSDLILVQPGELDAGSGFYAVQNSVQVCRETYRVVQAAVFLLDSKTDSEALR